jgi:hypothetical protein
MPNCVGVVDRVRVFPVFFVCENVLENAVLYLASTNRILVSCVLLVVWSTANRYNVILPGWVSLDLIATHAKIAADKSI